MKYLFSGSAYSESGHGVQYSPCCGNAALEPTAALEPAAASLPTAASLLTVFFKFRLRGFFQKPAALYFRSDCWNSRKNPPFILYHIIRPSAPPKTGFFKIHSYSSVAFLLRSRFLFRSHSLFRISFFYIPFFTFAFLIYPVLIRIFPALFRSEPISRVYLSLLRNNYKYNYKS